MKTGKKSQKTATTISKIKFEMTYEFDVCGEKKEYLREREKR